jgi:hypothetical protein
LCGPPSIPLSFSLAAVLPRRSTSRVGSAAEGVEPPDGQSTSFTAGTTGVSNPVRSPGLRASASGTGPGGRLRHGCSSRSLRISPLHREFHHPLPPSSGLVSPASARLSRGLSHATRATACARFTPSNSGQRSPPTSYRGCWHVVSRGLFPGYRQSRPREKRFTPRRASSRTRRCSVRLAPIAENPSLLPPVGVGAVSQSPCGWSSSQTSDRSSPRWAVTPPSS